jgi:hypothetical protein
MSSLGSLQAWTELEAMLGVKASVNSATEESYRELWLSGVAQQNDLGLMAVQGGLLADRLAWVFVAGYQAALRRTFPDQAYSGWAASAVSEDRRGDPPLQEWIISGWRTDLLFQDIRLGWLPSIPSST